MRQRCSETSWKRRASFLRWPDQAVQGRRERRVLCTQATEDAEMRRSGRHRRQDELRDDQVRRQTRLGALAAALDPDLDHDRALADVQGLGGGLDLVAE